MDHFRESAYGKTAGAFLERGLDSGKGGLTVTGGPANLDREFAVCFRTGVPAGCPGRRSPPVAAKSQQTQITETEPVLDAVLDQDSEESVLGNIALQ